MRSPFLSVLIAVCIPLIPASAQQRVITTIAGTDWLFPGDGRPAVSVPLGGAFSGLDIAFDRNGNYYICDADNLMVMRVGPDGIVNVIAGNGFPFLSGDGGLAINASLSFPSAIAVDSTGNIYIAEFYRIRKVTPDGIIHTFAGSATGETGFGGDNGPAASALFNNPLGLAVDLAGNVYISDNGNNRVRMVTPGGIITTIAGNGQPGRGGDGGRATAANLNQPTRIAVDLTGNLYIAEPGNQRVRKVDTHGIITTFAGGGCDISNPTTGCDVRDGGLATTEPMIPAGIGVDTAGNLTLADFFTGGVRKVDLQGRITTIAGNGRKGFSGDGGPALNASFYFFFNPSVAVDSAGNIFVGDDLNERVRKITPGGNVNTVAGNGLFHLSGNGGPATSASLDTPNSVIADNSGNVYIAETILSRIRRIAPDGTISVYAGNGTRGYSGDNGPAASASLSLPTYLTFDGNGNLYFSDSLNSVIRRIDGNGVITTYAGNGTVGFGGDGLPASKASFRAPEGIAFDSEGELIIADNQNNRLRVVLADLDNTVLTIAGDGTPDFFGENISSLKSRVNDPVGVRVYNEGVYFCDRGNHRVRRIDVGTLIITTVAGNGKPGNTGDGGQATQASLNSPTDVDFDAAGNMYIADGSSGVIRIVNPSGIINTFAGANKRSLGDGGPATAAGIGSPTDVFVDASGRVLIADTFFNRVRAVLTTQPSFQASPANLAFTTPAGSAPVDQQVGLIGSIPGILFSASATSSGWLSVSPASGSMPTALRVSVDPSAVSPGSYPGTVTITAPNASPTTRTVSVALTVTAAGQPSINLKPSNMTFSFVQGAGAVTRPLSVSNVGGGSLSFTVASATGAGGSWLKASPASGSVNAFASTPVSITANPAGLGPGTYSGTVTVSSANPAQSVIVPVTMTISAVPQTILIPQTGLTFFTVEGGGPPPPQFFNILNTRIGQMRWTTNASTLSGSSWLSAFPGAGVSDANSQIVPQVRVDVNPSGLQRGIYYGSVQVIAPDADNNPQFVSVILDVLPPGSNIGPLVQPIGLIFAAVAGGESPGSQSILVQNLNSTAVTFRSGRVTLDGNNWFTSLPPDGTITQAQPVRIVIQPQITGLATGVYRGSLTLSFSDGSVRSIALVLVLIPPGSTLPSTTTSFREAQGACVPKTLAPVFTLLSDGFSVPAGFPAQVAIKVVDDCANPMTTGSVVTSFSNGDTSIVLISLKDGTWAGTWQPQNKTPQVLVTGIAEIPEQGLTGHKEVTVSFQTQTGDPPPVVPMNSVTDAASYGLKVSPGGIISVFGTKLATGVASAAKLPLPTDLLGSSIMIAGTRVPLIFVSDGQVNAIVPYGIPVNTDHQIAIIRGASLSGPQHLTVAPASPGIFTTNQSGKGQGIIVDIANNIVDQNHPVKAGDAIVIYCTGLGEVSPPVPTGTPAPTPPPLSNTVNPVTVTIGGITVNPFFAGLTPGFPGLYQVNAIVPTGIAPGNQVSVFLTEAGQVSLPVTIAVR